jgi:tripartite-type tricarboxylate transporter receptor subunit TctC
MIGRRKVIAAVAAGAAMQGSGIVPLAYAQTYPTRVIRLVVPYGPGSGTDIVSRVVADAMSHDLAQQVIIENRAGADGAVGTSFVTLARPDGYTLLSGANGPLVTGPFIQKGLGYDPAKQLTPIAMLAYSPFILIVPAASPVKTVQDLVAAAEAQPGKVTYGSSGFGSSGHLAGALFEKVADVKMHHVPYSGASAVLIDVIAGRIDCFFAALPSANGAIKSGQVRAIAMATLKRSPLDPSLPTVAEAGYPGFDTGTWVSIVAPAGVSQQVVDTLSASAAKAVASQKVKDFLASVGAEPRPMGPAEFAAYLASERHRWQAVIKDIGLGTG